MKYWADGSWLALTATLALSASGLYAQSIDFAKSGTKVYGAWRCAAWASIIPDQKVEYERLFDLGFKLVVPIIDAARSTESPADDLDKMPIGLLLALSGGPTSDFIAGAAWNQISGDALSEHEVPAAGAMTSEERLELQRLSVEIAFRNGNCRLLE